MKWDNYHIFKIRYFASDYLLKKWHNGGKQPKQHWERAKQITEFKWKFVEKVTGISQTEWLYNYQSHTIECAMDYVMENNDIHVLLNNSKFIYILIPKEDEELYQWMVNTIENPYELIRRMQFDYFSDMDIKWRREWSKKLTEELYEKHPEWRKMFTPNNKLV
jgi:hypothetical protein